MPVNFLIRSKKRAYFYFGNLVVLRTIKINKKLRRGGEALRLLDYVSFYNLVREAEKCEKLRFLLDGN